MPPVSMTRLWFGARGTALGFMLLMTACAAPEVSKPPSAPRLDWTAAIGLLDGGTATLKCSAVLVAPNLIATAAHCFYPDVSADPLSASAFVFHPNLGGQPPRAEAHGTVIRAIGGLVMQGHITPAEAPNDWALMEIAPPVTAVQPVAIASYSTARMLERVAAGDRLFVGGYGNGTNDALHIPGDCRILAHEELKLQLDPRLILTDCVVRVGDSGGPMVLIDRAGKPVLIGVISGFGKHPTKTISLGFGANADSFAPLVKGPVISLLN